MVRYLRALQPGTVPTRGPLDLEHRDEDAPSLHDTFAVMFGGTVDDRDVLERVLRSPALAEQWRTFLVARRAEVQR